MAGPLVPAHSVVGVRVFTVMQAAGPLEARKPETVCLIGVGGDGKAGRSFPGEEVRKFQAPEPKFQAPGPKFKSHPGVPPARLTVLPLY